MKEVRPMTPVVRGLHLAERAEVDPVTRNLTIDNSFRVLRQRRLPGLVDPFYLVARMAGGLGNVRLLAQVSRLDTFAEVYRAWVTVNFPDRLQDVIFKLRVE